MYVPVVILDILSTIKKTECKIFQSLSSKIISDSLCVKYHSKIHTADVSNYL